MRWIVISCFLLASAHDIVSTKRPKRDLWSIKNLISSKLSGTDTIVIQLPKIPKNETYQLFKIKGYDNVFLKVNRKPEKEKVIERPVKVKYEDPVMVSPEIAIIGNYLGTTTHRETLLALEIANNLLKSGILRTERENVQEPMAPHVFYKEYIARKPIKAVEMITKERDPIYVDPSFIESETIVNRHPVAVYPAEYPPMVVASEVKYRPFQTRYSYKQETEDADMTYESFNNRDVIVKRTNQIPVYPAEYPPMVVASEEYRPFQTRYSYKQETEDADMTYESFNNRDVIVKRTNQIPVYPAEYPPMVVASEEYRPFQTRYSYQQETEDADMTYESYNNRDVIVKRTNKIPVKPRYIAVRLADVVSIAAKPHLIRSQQPVTSTVMPENNIKEPLKVVPIHSYVLEKVPQATVSPEVTEESEYVDTNNHNDPPSSFDINPPVFSETLDLPNFIDQSKLPFDIREHLTDGEIEQLNKFINAKLDLSMNNGEIFTPRPYYLDEEINSDDQKVVAGGSPINTGKIFSRYSYKQIGDEDHNNYTVVRIEDTKLNKNEINIMEPVSDIPQNYVYVPPNIAVLPSVPNKHNINALSTQNKYDEYENFNGDTEINPRTSVPITLRGDLRQTEVATEKPKKLKTNAQDSTKKTPIIVVPETEHKQIKVTTFKEGIKTTSGRPYTGGHRDNGMSRTSTTRSYTRRSGVKIP